jgi:small conductance mechanosensitive channel
MTVFENAVNFKIFLMTSISQTSITLSKIVDQLLNKWSDDSQEFVRTAMPRLIVIALIAFFLSHLLRLITSRMTHLAERSGAGPGRVGEVKTLAGVIRATGLTVITLISAFMALDAMNFHLAPLLASAGVAGMAIGLAAQNIVRDMFNGFLILVEGQFSVGDTVRIAGVSGVVEALTLRKTIVRDADGTRYVIPNSQITTVANFSAGYATSTVNISVDFSANPDTVAEMLKKIALDVRNDDAFSKIFLDDPQVLGVDAMKGSQMIFPVVFKTLPTKQYAPMREFQRRVRLAFEENHLLPGDPYRVYMLDGELAAASIRSHHEGLKPEHDATTIKPQENNPLAGE